MKIENCVNTSRGKTHQKKLGVGWGDCGLTGQNQVKKLGFFLPFSHMGFINFPGNCIGW